METKTITQEIPQPTVSELSKITGKYVIKSNRKTWLSTMTGNKDKRNLHVGTFTMFTPELDMTSGAIRTGITSLQLQREFEENLNNLAAGTLNPYNREYWGKYFIKIPSEGYVLDCSTNVKNKLNYLILRSSSKFYSDGLHGAAQQAIADWTIVSTDAEKAKESVTLDTITKAYAKLAGMSIQERIDFLKVYEEGKYSVGLSAKPDFVNSAVKQVIDESPKNFINTFDNPFYKEAIFLKDCVTLKLVVKQGPKYYINGGEKLGDSYLQTLMNLQSDDWQEVKISLLGKIQAHK